MPPYNSELWAAGVKQLLDSLNLQQVVMNGNKKPSSFYEEISSSVLMILGDRDTAPLQGALDLQRHLSQSSLGMLPKCGHYSLLEKPDLVAAMISDYLSQFSLT